jgi:hypothetical protein
MTGDQTEYILAELARIRELVQQIPALVDQVLVTGYRIGVHTVVDLAYGTISTNPSDDAADVAMRVDDLATKAEAMMHERLSPLRATPTAD